jgi:RecA-family ATPase
MTERTADNRASWMDDDTADPETERQADQAQQQKQQANGSDHSNFWTVPDPYELPQVRPIMHRAADWNTRTIPPMRWIAEDWIPRQQVTGLYGLGADYKTWLLMQGLMAKAAGLQFLGRLMEPEPSLGLFCEDTPEEIARRTTKIADFYGLPLSAFANFHWTSLVGFAETELVTFDSNNRMQPSLLLHALDQFIQQHRISFVALDTIAHMFGGEEVRRRDVARFLRQLDAISITRDCAFLFAAQPSLAGRRSGTMESGSTHWDAGVRSRLGWSNPDKKDNDDGAPDTDPNIIRRRLTRHKSNYARSGETMDLIFRNGGFIPADVDHEEAQLRQSGPGRDAACDNHFLSLLGKVRPPGYVNKNPSTPGYYAPTVFSRRPDGSRFSKPEYERAMARLEVAERIHLETFGTPPSKAKTRLTETKPSPQPAEDTNQ